MQDRETGMLPFVKERGEKTMCLHLFASKDTKTVGKSGTLYISGGNRAACG